ncbi:MAG: AI-2E family transporter [Micavibrio sp.]
MPLSTPVKAGFWAGFALFLAGFLWLFNSILAPFILGIIIAYLLNPVVQRFSQKRIPRWATALIILLLFFGTLTLMFLLLAPMALRQTQMLIEQIPNYLQSALDYLHPYIIWLQERMGDNYLDQINAYLKDNAGKAVAASGGIAAGLAQGGKALVGFMTTLVITPLVAFFMIQEWPNIVRWVEGLYPRKYKRLLQSLAHQIDVKVAGFIRGQISVAFMLGMIYAISLSIAGLNYGFLIGIGAGVFSIIPLVGSTLGLLVAVVVAWFQTGEIAYTAMIAAIFMSGQFIEGNFLSPKIVGDSVGLHPLWVLFALMAGGSLLGITGMLIAVPVAAVIGVLGSFAVSQYKASSLYQADDGEAPPVIITDEKD